MKTEPGGKPCWWKIEEGEKKAEANTGLKKEEHLPLEKKGGGDNEKRKTREVE